LDGPFVQLHPKPGPLGISRHPPSNLSTRSFKSSSLSGFGRRSYSKIKKSGVEVARWRVAAKQMAEETPVCGAYAKS